MGKRTGIVTSLGIFAISSFQLAVADEIVDFTKLNTQQIRALFADDQPGGKKKANKCRTDHCGNPSGADYGACSDWCSCVHNNPKKTKKQCDDVYKEDTGKDKAPAILSGDDIVEGCSDCSVRSLSTKTCFIEDYLGPEEDFTFVADCNLKGYECSRCEQSFSIEQVCCVDGNCAPRSCAIVRPISEAELKIRAKEAY